MTAMEPSPSRCFGPPSSPSQFVVYVILDGFDLGVGILFGTTRDAALRDRMMDSISPFWAVTELSSW
jgi:cytochrome d ubiquinol oxidase subunit II